jgi:hypothetical protein
MHKNKNKSIYREMNDNKQKLKDIMKSVEDQMAMG